MFRLSLTKELQNLKGSKCLISSDRVDVLPLELSNYVRDYNRDEVLTQIKLKQSDKPKNLKNAAQVAEYDTILRF